MEKLNILIVTKDIIVGANVSLQLTTLGYLVVGIISNRSQASFYLNDPTLDIVAIDIDLRYDMEELAEKIPHIYIRPSITIEELERKMKQVENQLLAIKDADSSTQSDDGFLKKVYQIIMDNLDQSDFGPTDLADALEISRTHLHRKLKDLTDTSTSNYIKKVRLQEAKYLLQGTDRNISEVAFAVGFTTLRYFSTSFMKEFDYTPTEYRKLL